MDITPWPGGEREKLFIVCRGQVELSVLVVLSGDVLNFS